MPLPAPVVPDGATRSPRPRAADAFTVRRRLAPSALRTFILQMRRDPTAEFQTEDAAAGFGVPPIVFIRAFKKMTGLSPQRFRAALRIELAKRLLVETDRPVTEISFDVGYNSLGTFVRTFTLLVGLPPGQLRRLARGGDPAEILGDGHGFDPPPADAPALYGVLAPPLPGGVLLAAGLFPQGLPAGLPFDGCFVDPAAPSFRLAWPPGRRRASLLAAAVAPFSFAQGWAGRLSNVEVCNLSLSAPPAAAGGAPLRLRLRPLADTDPPFLTPIPLLMLLQSRRSGRAPTGP